MQVGSSTIYFVGVSTRMSKNIEGEVCPWRFISIGYMCILDSHQHFVDATKSISVSFFLIFWYMILMFLIVIVWLLLLLFGQIIHSHIA